MALFQSELLASGEPCDRLPNAFFPRLGPFRRVNPHDEVSPVGRRQCSKEFPGGGVPPQRLGDVGGQLRDDRAWPVAVCRWCRCTTGCREQAGGLELRPSSAIAVGPFAGGASRRHFEGIAVVIETSD